MLGLPDMTIKCNWGAHNNDKLKKANNIWLTDQLQISKQNISYIALLKTEASSLALILYQDAFGVANPVGSGWLKTQVACTVSEPCLHFPL